MTHEQAKALVDNLTDDEVDDLIRFFTENKKENENDRDR